MIILKKKRVGIVFLSLIIFLSFATIINKNESVETMAWTSESKVIVLDAGHGIPDEGAQSDEGITEASINLAIAKKVQKLLEEAGNTVILTRKDENAIYDEGCTTIREMKVSDIKNRVKIGNESSADIFVSIHLNKIPQKQYWGWQTFFKENNENSKKLATCIQEGLSDMIDKKNKRVPLKIKNIYIVDHVNIPITIVECGFLSNEEEEKLLQTDEYQNKLAQGIYLGILKYFSK